MLDKKRAGIVDISDFVVAVTTIVKGSTEERLQCMFCVEKKKPTLF
jgi:hypothetical protein